MNIAHIVCTYPPYHGGMGNVAFQTAAALSRRGHNVSVFTPGVFDKKEMRPRAVTPAKKHSPQLQENIDYAKRLRPMFQYGNAAYLPTLKKELDDFDLVHLHYPFFGTAHLVRDWKKRNPDTPLVITYHMDARSPGWKGMVFKWYAHAVMPGVLKAADLLIGSSLDYIQHSHASKWYDAFPQRWKGLPFGVDLQRFQPVADVGMIAESIGLDPEIPTLGFVGGMDQAHYFKGIPYLLQALRRVQKKGIAVQALLVGDGALRTGFEQQARALGLEGVHFVGRIEDGLLPLYYHMMDFFVLPSINMGEAFGMVLLEAMATGTPVIASDLPGVRTVVQDFGMVVPPKNSTALAMAIETMAATIDHVDHKAIRSYVEQEYNWDVLGKTLDDWYQGLVAK